MGRWRTEVWRDVQLEVPDAWRLGYAPMAEGDGALLCGIGAHERTRAPYVGRPGYGSDMCQGVELDDLAMTGEGLWFGSPLPDGDVLAKNGLHQTTVAVDDTTVTVATFDEEVREQVLASFEQVRGEDRHGCPAAPEVQRSWPDEGYGDPVSLSLCVYEQERGSAPARMWTDRLDGDVAAAFVLAVERGQPARCEPAPKQDGLLLLLRVHAEDPAGSEPLLRDFLLRTGGCPAMEAAGMMLAPTYVRLTSAIVKPWSSPGVRTYVYASGLTRGLARFFRPIWG
jgi:hypothetical protein